MSAAPARGLPAADDADIALPAVLDLAEAEDLAGRRNLTEPGELGEAEDLADPPPRMQHGPRERNRARDLFKQLSRLPADDAARARGCHLCRLVSRLFSKLNRGQPFSNCADQASLAPLWHGLLFVTPRE